MRKRLISQEFSAWIAGACTLSQGVIIEQVDNIMSEFTLRIDNMHCGSCVRRVSQVLASTGHLQVKEVRVGAARLGFTDSTAPVELALAALAKAGYPARLED